MHKIESDFKENKAIFTENYHIMNTDSIKQRLIAELNENSILLYAERQKLKEDHLPKELLEEMLKKHKKQRQWSKVLFGVLGAFLIMLQFYIVSNENANPFLQNVMLQFMPILGISYFSASHQNYGKRIFILELLLDWEK